MSIDFTDIFCGAGGSSIGLVAAGLLRALDDVLDSKQHDAGHDLSARHLQQRVDREPQALSQAG